MAEQNTFKTLYTLQDDLQPSTTELFIFDALYLEISFRKSQRFLHNQ